MPRRKPGNNSACPLIPEKTGACPVPDQLISTSANPWRHVHGTPEFAACLEVSAAARLGAGFNNRRAARYQRPRSGSARKPAQAKPQRGDPEKSQDRKLLFGNDTEGRDGFVKMAGFQFVHRTTSQLIRSAKMRYSRSFLSLFTKFERLRRHNFAHFTSSPLEKRVIRHELLDCGWTEADQRAV